MKKTLHLSLLLLFVSLFAFGCADEVNDDDNLDLCAGDACGTADQSDGACEPNACGGCAILNNAPGDGCGACGVLVCDGEDALTCEEGVGNACGGCQGLGAEPGDACGLCGTISCDGIDATRCDDPGQNSCGGCATLEGTKGDVCGECGRGEWVCDGTDAIECQGDVKNPCGGCTDFGISEPGDFCGTCGGGQLACAGDNESLLCEGGDETNACDGCGVLNGAIGDPCGDCYTGELNCNGAGNALVCVGATECVACQGPDNNDTFAMALHIGNYKDSQDNPVSHSSDLYGADDVDVFRVHMEDTFWAGVDIQGSLAGQSTDLDLCFFWERDDNRDSNIECSAGELREVDGLQGCCSENDGLADEAVAFDDKANAAGGDDHGNVYVYVYTRQATLDCTDYSVSFSF